MATNRLSREDLAKIAFTGIVLPVCATLIAQLPLVWTGALTLGVTAVVVILLLRNRPFPSGDTLRRIGIEDIRLTNPISAASAVAESSQTLLFWGVSGNRTVRDAAVRDAIVRIGHARGSVQFLLLDPNSKWVEKRAALEKQPGESVRADIRSTIGRLQSLAVNENINIEIRLYDEPPVWRILATDGHWYVHYFLPGKQGPASPQLKVAQSDIGLAHPLREAFSMCWERANRA